MGWFVVRDSGSGSRDSGFGTRVVRSGIGANASVFGPSLLVIFGLWVLPCFYIDTLAPVE
jgi:hypothetical protein